MKKFMKNLSDLINSWSSSFLFRSDEVGNWALEYISNEWYILPEKVEDLDRLLFFMKRNPGKRIEITASVDSNGNENFHRGLLQLNADSASQYILSMGIAESRVLCNDFGYSPLHRFRLLD
jgi:hypothetical protein